MPVAQPSSPRPDPAVPTRDFDHRRVQVVDLAGQYAALQPEVDAAVGRVLASGRYVLGPEVEAFERALAEFVGTAHAVGVASGTDALWLGLRALGVGPGAEVVTSPLSFVATAMAIVRVGARPVFADIDPETYAITPACVARACTARTKAILPVHLYGHPADVPGLRARLPDIPVLEDAAQAIGSAWHETPCGALGALAAFSFYPTKSLGAVGDAGAVTTDDPALAARVRALRVSGSTDGVHYESVGLNSRLDALQAAILRVKLDHLPGWLDRQRAVAHLYDICCEAYGLLDAGVVRLPHTASGAQHTFHQYVVRVPAAERDALRGALTQKGVAAAIYYPLPLHRQPALAEFAPPGGCPEAERAAAETLALPCHPTMDEAQVDYVVKLLCDFARARGLMPGGPPHTPSA